MTDRLRAICASKRYIIYRNVQFSAVKKDLISKKKNKKIFPLFLFLSHAALSLVGGPTPREYCTRAAARQRGMRGRGASHAEVTIDANLSKCHVSTAAGTQYIHAMDDDDGTTGRAAPFH